MRDCREYLNKGFISTFCMTNKGKCKENTKRLKLKDINICPNILHVGTDADGITFASSSALQAEMNSDTLSNLYLKQGTGYV